MSDQTPTERAIALLRKSSHDPGRFAKRELHTDGWPDELHVWQAKAALVALKSDPALLFDLAVEAGALEQVGWQRGTGPGRRVGLFFALDPDATEHAEDEADSTLQPVYRRVEPTEETK